MNKCDVCMKPVKRNNPGQIVYYCTDKCRKLRHNKFKFLKKLTEIREEHEND